MSAMHHIQTIDEETKDPGLLPEGCMDELDHWQMSVQETDNEYLKIVDRHDLVIAYVTRGISRVDLRSLLRARNDAFQIGIVVGREEVRRQLREIMGYEDHQRTEDE